MLSHEQLVGFKVFHAVPNADRNLFLSGGISGFFTDDREDVGLLPLLFGFDGFIVRGGSSSGLATDAVSNLPEDVPPDVCDDLILNVRRHIFDHLRLRLTFFLLKYIPTSTFNSPTSFTMVHRLLVSSSLPCPLRAISLVPNVRMTLKIASSPLRFCFCSSSRLPRSTAFTFA